MSKRKLEEVKKINLDRLMTVENLNQQVLYDIPKEYILEMGEIFNIKKIIDEIKKSDEKEKYMITLANQVGERLFELENKYRDRTGEVIDFVAQKTGIYFPHVFQRYIEFFYTGTHPEDRFHVFASTIRELKISFPSCSFKKSLIDNGLGDKTCAEFCRSVFEKIKSRLKLNIRITIKQDPGTDYCEHHFFSVT